MSASCYVLGSGAFQTPSDATAFVNSIVALHASAREPPACLTLCLGASDRKAALGGTTRITGDQARELLRSVAEDAGLFGSWWKDTFAQIERWALFRPSDNLEIFLVQDRVDRRPLDWGDDCRQGLDNLRDRRARLPAEPRTRFRLVGAGDAHAAFTAVAPRNVTTLRGLFEGAPQSADGGRPGGGVPPAGQPDRRPHLHGGERDVQPSLVETHARRRRRSLQATRRRGCGGRRGAGWRVSRLRALAAHPSAGMSGRPDSLPDQGRARPCATGVRSWR